MKKIITYSVFLIIIGIGFAFFFLSPSSAGKSADNIDDISKKIAIPVKVIPATIGLIQEYIKLSGDVRASSTVDVLSNTSGKILGIRVKEGQYVLKDQILGTVDPSRPGTSFVESPVKAPISGTITRVFGQKGGSISPSIPIFQIGQLNDLEVLSHVSERNIWKVKTGQKALLTAHAVPGKNLTAFVSEIAPVVDIKSRTMEITLSLNGDSQYLKSGMLTDVTLITEEHRDVVTIPESTIISRDGSLYVYVISENIALLRQIETGVSVDGFVQVNSGISDGDLIVISGQTLLADQSEVLIRETLDGLPVNGNIED